MAISAQTVKDLREQTGAGMMECKKALEQSNGNMEEAIEWLRKQGLKAAGNKAARVAAEGCVATALNAQATEVAMVEVNCETDFVARNEDFTGLANAVAQLVLQKNPSNLEALLEMPLSSGEKVVEKVNNLTAKIGEKISIRRFHRGSAAAGEKIGTYIHMGAKIGVIVTVKGTKAEEALLKDIAMHVAASSPRYLQKTEIPAEVLEKEKNIFLEQMKDSGKPANILEKMVEGKLAKFASEVCLVDQIFIKDPTGKKSVSQILKELGPDHVLVSFTRFQVGEGIEKKKDDFASEVAKMVG